MKKGLILFIIFISVSSCYAQEEFEPNNTLTQTEIHLDTGVPNKTYKLKKVDHVDVQKKDDDEDDDLPFDFMPSPLKLLQTYRSETQD